MVLYQAKKDNQGVKASKDIPNVMKAVVALGAGKEGKSVKDNYEFREDYKTPELDEGKVLLEVEYSGMCHTDLLCIDGIMVEKGPIIPGHEFAGTIVATGPNVDETFLDMKAVALCLYGGSGKQPNLSHNTRFAGVMVDGGFANYFKIKPEHLVMIPEGVTTKQAFWAGDAGMTSRHAIAKIMKNYEPGESPRVIVYGATGGLGVATILNLIAAGVKPEYIYAVDIRQKYLDKLKKSLGVNIVNSEGKPVAYDLIAKIGFVDAAIDCYGSGGNIKKAYAALEEMLKEKKPLELKTFKKFLEEQFMKQGTVNDAIKITRKGGDVQVIGSRGDHILYPTGDFMATEKHLNGPWGGCPEDTKAVLSLIKEGKITNKRLELLLGKELQFTEKGVKRGIKALRAGEVMGRIYFKME